jgi:hypothetical protein
MRRGLRLPSEVPGGGCTTATVTRGISTGAGVRVAAQKVMSAVVLFCAKF